jgi:pilus assembly protein FimV
MASDESELVDGAEMDMEAADQMAMDAGEEEEDVSAEAEPQAVEVPEVVAPQTPETEPGLVDMLMANLLYIGIALVVVVLGLVALVFVRKRGGADGSDTLDLSDAEETMMDMDTQETDTEAPVDTDLLQDEGSIDELEQSLSMDEDLGLDEVAEEPSVAADTAPETGDAISEADIYISFGSFDKAESLLKSAISSEPGRSDLQLKLLEVYVAADNLASFDEQYAALEALGDAGAIDSAREMRNRISGADVSPLPAADVSADSSGGDDLDLSLDLEEAPTDDSADESFDLDLSLDEEPEAADSTSADLDFDLDLSLDEEVADISESPTVAQPAINLGEAPTVQQPAVDVSEAPTAQQQAVDASDMPTAVSPAVQVGEADTEMREELDLDIPEADAAGDAAKAVANDEPTPSGTGLDEDFDFLADADEAATKLDLARAYIDMGDKEGAKDILQEVLEEGQDAQKQEAQQLLDSLG